MNRLDLTRPLQQRCGRRAWVMTPPKGADMLVGYMEDSDGVVLRTNWHFNGSWFGTKPTAHDLVYDDEPATVPPKPDPIADLTRRVEALEAQAQPAKTAVDRLWEWKREASFGKRGLHIGQGAWDGEVYARASTPQRSYEAAGYTPEAAAEALLEKLEVERE